MDVKKAQEALRTPKRFVKIQYCCAKRFGVRKGSCALREWLKHAVNKRSKVF